MLKPIEFILNHRELIMSVYNQNTGMPKKTWCELLTEESLLPKLDQVMKFNTFKQYLQVLIAVDKKLQEINNKELSKLRQIINQKDKELLSLSIKLKDMERKLPKIGQKTQNINGWTVRLTSKGYYNLCKSFNGKVESIYIGKSFDQQKAKEKISERMSKLRQQKIINELVVN